MKNVHVGLMVLVIAGAILTGIFWKNSDNKIINENQEQNQNQEKNQNQKQNQDQNQVNNQASEIINPSGLYSINELFIMNKPMKCAWKENATGDKDVTNIIYISGKKFYQDVAMSDIGHGFTINNGEYLYIWNDFNDAASKIKNTEAETGKPAQGTAELEQKKDFICENWPVDDSIFNPPQDRNFQDVTEEMNQAFEGMSEGSLENSKQQICDLCQNAPTQELKDICLKSAKCVE